MMRPERDPKTEPLHLRVADGPMALVCGEEFSGQWFVRARAALTHPSVGNACPACLRGSEDKS